VRGTTGSTAEANVVCDHHGRDGATSPIERRRLPFPHPRNISTHQQCTDASNIVYTGCHSVLRLTVSKLKKTESTWKRFKSCSQTDPLRTFYSIFKGFMHQVCCFYCAGCYRGLSRRLLFAGCISGLRDALRSWTQTRAVALLLALISVRLLIHQRGPIAYGNQRKLDADHRSRSVV
jgi:hypothetical protein